MASMSKKALNELFRRLLEEAKEDIRHFAGKDSGAAMICCGKVCGYVRTMEKLELIDWEQSRFIQDEAFALVQGREPEYEGC